LKEIKIERVYGDKIIVKEGILEGEKVVLDGVFLLRDGDKISEIM